MHVPSFFCFQPGLVGAILGYQQHVEAGLGVEADPVGGGMEGYPLQGPGVVQLDGIRHLADVEAAGSTAAISRDEALQQTEQNNLMTGGYYPDCSSIFRFSLFCFEALFFPPPQVFQEVFKRTCFWYI